ncbi:MAG: hemerythrin domain-containing protein [Saprospiraceae bacterium]|nr:hemerythrin domain-containing protein [Saprospiraceae bacterium]
MIELKVINKVDPLKRIAEKHDTGDEYSPMDPPDAYAPPGLEKVDYKDMHPFLQELMDEHKIAAEKLKIFEETLLNMQKTGVDRKTFAQLGDFFEFFDLSITKHNRKEEKTVFPFLHRKLKEIGEHSNGPDEVTAVDMMEDDHIKSLQLAAVVFNFFGIAMNLPDAPSRLIVLDTAIEQGKALIELLRLHIFREDNIVFALANRHLSVAELDNLSRHVD